MENFPYKTGSIWRKWDLQAQTILDDGYTQLGEYYEDFKNSDATKWNEYVSKVGGETNALLYDSKAYFNDGAIPKIDRCANYVRNFFAFLDVFNPELKCLGITDHNYFDDLLIDMFVEYAEKSFCKIIPGVEINCQGIHMLLFFAAKPYARPTFSAGIQSFLMKFDINNRKNSAGTLTTTSCDIKRIIDEVKRLGGVIIYPHCNSNNGLFQERTKTDRTHLADIFNYQKVNLLQSQQHSSSLAIAGYIGTNAALSSKYCCHISSDARALKDFGRPDSAGNYLWVKADPTFEGLKQICYEPNERLFVGPHKPEEKKPYFIIDKVRFIDNTSEARFSSEFIEINQNLTTIIGGKSTGKSLLLYYVAKTIDTAEVKARILTAQTEYGYDFDAAPDFNFEVIWGDGQNTLLKVPVGTQTKEIKQRKSLYIPQRYLNTLSESNIKSKEALNEFVLNVLLQDSSISTKYSVTMREIKAVSKDIPIRIAELFSERDDIVKTEEELKQMGDAKGIETYIETLQKQVNDIKAKSGFTDDQLKQYEDLVTREKEIATELANFEEDKKTIQNLHISLGQQLDGIRRSLGESEGYLTVPDIRAKFKVEFKVLETFAPAISAATTSLIGTIDAQVKALADSLAKIKADLAPLLAKVQLQSELQGKTDAIKKEQQKLNEIAIKNNSVKNRRASYAKKSESVIDLYKLLITKYDGLRNEFKAFESKFGEIALGVHVAFRNEVFNSLVVREFLNRNDLKRNIAEAEWGQEYVYQYDPTKHVANIVTVFQGLLDAKINTIKNRPSKDAVTKLLEDYFYLDFRIFFKNDPLDKMSPGKKGLVLLQLLINLSDEEWPILLDQPEDDLDNRSVYEDLVIFLKKKKAQRQIIIVTHNPNLVVGADAEESIVANQSGQEAGRENKKFRFEYVSGALENTFELEKSLEPAVLLQKGIRQHVCEILEGGKEAFKKREEKYAFS